MNHDERIRQLLGQKPDLSDQEFDRGCLPATLYLIAVLVVGVSVELCSMQ